MLQLPRLHELVDANWPYSRAKSRIEMFRLRIRQLSSAITIMAFLLAIVGFPLPQSIPGGDEDFPCKDHGCGCTTALMCRTACCCAKPAVKTKIETAKPAGGCCSTKHDNRQKAPKSRWAIQAASCQGLSATWSGLGLIVPPEFNPTGLILVRHIVSQLPTDHHLIPLATLLIEPPPPRPEFS